MSNAISVERISPDDWSRLREIRLASLAFNPEAFGGSYELESKEDEFTWREKFTKLDFLIASVEGFDAALMSIEKLAGDFGATCWIGGCWTHPEHRSRGLLRAIMSFIDEQDRGWKAQGLGVFVDNYDAIAAYEKLGFVKMGDEVPSTRQPGKFYQRMLRKSSN